jgi:hypothetical protein
MKVWVLRGEEEHCELLASEVAVTQTGQCLGAMGERTKKLTL